MQDFTDSNSILMLVQDTPVVNEDEKEQCTDLQEAEITFSPLLD